MCQHASAVETKNATGYTVDVQVLLSGDERPIVVSYGDASIISRGVVSKARLGGQRGSILLKMHGDRMWAGFPSELIKSDNTLFEQKRGSAVWRGATTGGERPPERKLHKLSAYLDGWTGPRHQRAALIRRIPSLTKAANISVAVSRYVQGVPENMFGTPSQMSMRSLLRHQMIIVAEGNDVATSTKWALASQSAVLMPSPTKSSWLAEELLVPWKHFVPLQPGFEDLEEKVQWCLDNQVKCAQIARNGQCFMSAFFDIDDERRLLQEVIAVAKDRTARSGACAKCPGASTWV